MGFKAFKQHFRINIHSVSIEDGVLRIGSDYVSNLVGIDMQTGKILINDTFSGFLQQQYPEILNCTDEERLALIQVQDQFEQSIPVYTCSNGQIIEKQCEALGYPNTTHDGEIMYSNTHFANKIDAVKHEKVNLECRIENYQESITELEKKLADKKLKLEESKKRLSEIIDTYSLVN